MMTVKFNVVRYVMLLVALFVLGGVFSADASVRYTVKKGDNPSSIGRKYKVSARAIMEENGITENDLRPGTKIVIPSKNKSASIKSASGRSGMNGKKEKIAAVQKARANVKQDTEKNSEVGPEKVAASKPLAGDLYHVVKKGDTISSIARKYSITAGELKDLNKLKSTRLKTGRKLLVKKIGPKTYIVKKGDNIWRIARKFEVDADDLMELNEMSTPDLRVGQKLYLEEAVDTATNESVSVAVTKNYEEEIKKIAETEEFKEKDQPNKLITFARKLINIPYKFGGNSILGIDCSGYVKKVYGLLGVELPRTAREQFKEGEEIAFDDLSVGDLVFFRTYASFPSHVGIYLGNNLFIHASSRGKKVTIDSLETPYYFKRFIGGKRLLTEREHGETEQDSAS